ncbi:hypothetical protein [Nesterenkonia suensis]
MKAYLIIHTVSGRKIAGDMAPITEQEYSQLVDAIKTIGSFNHFSTFVEGREVFFNPRHIESVCIVKEDA